MKIIGCEGWNKFLIVVRFNAHEITRITLLIGEYCIQATVHGLSVRSRCLAVYFIAAQQLCGCIRKLTACRCALAVVR